jgi:ABC-type amino acid transport substrate-binding protein
VGIDPSLPPFSYMDGDEAKGFVVDLADELANALGVKAEYFQAPTDTMLISVNSGVLDVVFPLRAITERTAKQYGVTDPYYIAHERVLVEAGEKFPPGVLCDLTDPETEVRPEEIDGSGFPVSGPADCVEALRAKKANGAVGADPLLMTVLTLAAACEAPCHSDQYSFTIGQLSTEGFSAVIAAGNTGWQDYIDNVFDDTKSEGRWSEYYDHWLRPYIGGPSEPPDMTAEEAAALFPKDVGPVTQETP